MYPNVRAVYALGRRVNRAHITNFLQNTRFHEWPTTARNK